VEEKRGPGQGTDTGAVEAGGAPCGNRGGGPARMDRCGVTGQLLDNVGRSGENGKFGPTQEAQCRFHNYSKKFKRI
jgi:hypothetical protein